MVHVSIYLKEKCELQKTLDEWSFKLTIFLYSFLPDSTPFTRILIAVIGSGF